MYVRSKIIIAGISYRAVKKVEQGKPQAVLWREGKTNMLLTLTRAKEEYQDRKQAHTALRRI
jgi:hypothetical protein